MAATHSYFFNEAFSRSTRSRMLNLAAKDLMDCSPADNDMRDEGYVQIAWPSPEKQDENVKQTTDSLSLALDELSTLITKGKAQQTPDVTGAKSSLLDDTQRSRVGSTSSTNSENDYRPLLVPTKRKRRPVRMLRFLNGNSNSNTSRNKKNDERHQVKNVETNTRFMENTTTHTVQISRSPGKRLGLGITSFGRSKPVKITSLERSGLAATQCSGDIHIGDIIVGINGEEIGVGAHSVAAQILAMSKNSTITLTIKTTHNLTRAHSKNSQAKSTEKENLDGAMTQRKRRRARVCKDRLRREKWLKNINSSPR
eukprot:m.15617 g.15617  ORF g.15617 m.15617 type:complete len:312 (-) comp5448_c0_seq1:211-1146(-)